MQSAFDKALEDALIFLSRSIFCGISKDVLTCAADWLR